MKIIAITAVSTCATAILTACGGGGGDGPVPIAYLPGTEVPVGVQTQVGEVLSFARLQIAHTSDSDDPLLLGDATLAASDTDEPDDI